MILYTLLIGYLIVLYMANIIVSKKYRRFFIISGMAPLLILSGLRNIEIGNDTLNYVGLFNGIARTTELSVYVNGRYEIGYILYNYILSFISTNELFFLFFTSTILIYSYSFIIDKYSKNIMISIILFLLCGFWAESMNIIRMQIAIVILLFSYESIKANNLKKFICYILFAVLFHKTSIIFLLAYPLYHSKLKIKHYLFIFLCLFFAYYYFTPLLEFIAQKMNFYTDYSNTIYQDGNVRLASVINILITFVYLLILLFIKYKIFECTKKEIQEDQSEIDISIKFLIMTWCINILSLKFNLLDRCSDYFFVFMIFLLPNVIESINDRKLRNIIYILFILFYIIYFFTILIYRPNWNHIYPYKFYWN